MSTRPGLAGVRRRLAPASLRARLLTVVGIALVPAVALVVWTGLEQRSAARQETSLEAVRLAHLAAASTESVLEGVQQLLAAVSQLPEVQAVDARSCSGPLTRLLHENSRYANLGVARLDGSVVCSALPLPRPVDISDRAYFRVALAEQDFAIGEFQRGRITGRDSLNAGYPVRDASGRAVAVAFAAIDLGFLSSAAAGAELPEGATVTVLDDHGTIVARHPDGGRWVGQSLPQAGLVEAALTGGHGAVETDGVDGVSRLYGLAAAGAAGATRLHVTVGIPSSVAGAKATGLLVRNLAGLGVVALLSVAAAWLLGGRVLVRPVEAIRATARRLAQGDLSGTRAPREAAGPLGEIASDLGSVADVLRERAAELARAEERFRLIAENARDLVAIVDEDGRCVYASPSFRRVLGHSPGALPGRPLRDLVHPADRARVRDWARSEACELRLASVDGSWTWFESSGATASWQGRRFAVVIARDIGDRKELEEQLRQSQKLEAMGSLAAGVAHDFNNLLTAIGGYAEFLELDLASPDRLRADVAEIRKATEQAATLTRQLLAFGRRQALDPVALDLNAAVRDTEEMLRRLLGVGVELTVDLADGPLVVHADPGQLTQVVVNLAVNARDAMPDGGRVTIRTDRLRLDERYADAHAEVQPGDYAVLVVADTGCGIDPETRARIFEPFFTTKERGKGTGLGLATVYGIIKQSDGHIWVYSKPGRGTTFKIYLPTAIAASDRPRPSTRRALARSRIGTGTVLLVDDDQLVRAFAERALAACGYRVLAAADEPEALELLLRDAAIDLLVTDAFLPGTSGLALATRLVEARPGLRVLFTSGYLEEGIASRREFAGIGDVLEKPFSAAALTEKVAEILARRAGARSRRTSAA